MPRYNIESQITITVYTVVEAENEEAARVGASGRGVQSLQYDGQSPGLEWCHTGELDGVPDLDVWCEIEEVAHAGDNA